MNLNDLQRELFILGEDGNSDVVMRGLIVMSQLGDVCRFITHDQVLNPTVRPHENPSLEAHAAGHAILQLMTLIDKRGINIEQAIELALNDLREHTCMRKTASDGIMASPGTVHSEAIVVQSCSGLNLVYRSRNADKILVTDHATAEIPLHLFSGVITNQGGYTCHAGIICRERHIPCVVGMGNATERFKTGDLLSISDGVVEVLKHAD